MTALTITTEAPLTTGEEHELMMHEGTISAGLNTFIKVGNALAYIRERRLYRANYDTFEEYCRSKWNLSKTHANRMIGAAEVAEDLTPIGVIPNSESQVRPLASLPTEQRREAWQQAVAASGKAQPTASAIQQAVQAVKPKANPYLAEFQERYQKHGATLIWVDSHGVYEIIKPNKEKVSTPHWAAVNEYLSSLQREAHMARTNEKARLVQQHSEALESHGYTAMLDAHGSIWVSRNGKQRPYSEADFSAFVAGIYDPITIAFFPDDRQQLREEILHYVTTNKIHATSSTPALIQLLEAALFSL